MTAFLTLDEVPKRLEGDICEVCSKEDSDFKGDGIWIYGYIAEGDITLSLAALCSEGVLDTEKEDDLDSNIDYASLILQKVWQYLGLACKLLTIDN